MCVRADYSMRSYYCMCWPWSFLGSLLSMARLCRLRTTEQARKDPALQLLNACAAGWQSSSGKRRLLMVDFAGLLKAQSGLAALAWNSG